MCLTPLFCVFHNHGPAISSMLQCLKYLVRFVGPSMRRLHGFHIEAKCTFEHFHEYLCTINYNNNNYYYYNYYNYYNNNNNYYYYYYYNYYYLKRNSSSHTTVSCFCAGEFPSGYHAYRLFVKGELLCILKTTFLVIYQSTETPSLKCQLLLGSLPVPTVH